MDELGSLKQSEKECRCIVRIKTSCWSDDKGVHVRKDILRLKRLSKGHDFVHEDVANIGATQWVEACPELYNLDDGVYEVIITNVRTDWETGYVDDYDYGFVPYNEIKQ
jgi:hypothetical protein